MVFVRDALECLITENLSRGSIELPVCRLFINIAAVGPLLKVGETKKKAPRHWKPRTKSPQWVPPTRLTNYSSTVPIYIYFFQLATHFSLGSRFYDLTGVTPPLSPIYSRPKMPAPLDKTVRRAARNDINLYRGANKAETTI